MPSDFRIDKDGVPIVDADPNSDLDYSVSSWLEGLLFTAVDWVVTPDDGNVEVYNSQINAAPVVIDGVTYAIGQLASTWIRGMVVGTTYEIRLRGTFTGNRIDDRTFRVRCKER
jgi:hypothetical protein